MFEYKTLYTLGMITLARLGSAQLCLHWVGYHETIGGVNAVQQENIVTLPPKKT